jgi:hypothetical protein
MDAALLRMTGKIKLEWWLRVTRLSFCGRKNSNRLRLSRIFQAEMVAAHSMISFRGP